MNTLQEILKKACELKAKSAGIYQGEIFFKVKGRELDPMKTDFFTTEEKSKFFSEDKQLTSEEYTKVKQNSVGPATCMYYYDEDLEETVFSFHNTDREMVANLKEYYKK